MKKQIVLLTCSFFLFHIIVCETSLKQTVINPQVATVQNNNKPKKEERDTAPAVISTIFQGVIPHLVQAAVHNEVNDTAGALNHCAQACQAWGNLLTYLSRAIKRNPKTPVNRLLKKYFASTRGKQFIKTHIS